MKEHLRSINSLSSYFILRNFHTDKFDFRVETISRENFSLFFEKVVVNKKVVLADDVHEIA